MNSTVLFVLLFSHQGHWLAGHEESIGVRLNHRLDSPVHFNWVLGYKEVSIASGRVKLEYSDKVKQIRIEVPDVRVQTRMRLVYRFEQKDGKVLDEGEQAIIAYPDNLLSGLAEQQRDKQLIVLDRADRLPALLKKFGIEHLQIDDESQLTLKQPDIILVGPDHLDNRPFGQDAILGQARGGAKIFSFVQTRVTKLADFELVERTTPVDLTWSVQDKITRHVRERKLSDCDAGLRALRMQVKDAKRRLVFWPKTRSSDEFDVLMAVYEIGKGQWVFCQIPLGDLCSDPRNQLFLADILTFLSVERKTK